MSKISKTIVDDELLRGIASSLASELRTKKLITRTGPAAARTIHNTLRIWFVLEPQPARK